MVIGLIVFLSLITIVVAIAMMVLLKKLNKEQNIDEER
jgi:hypothetical protein